MLLGFFIHLTWIFFIRVTGIFYPSYWDFSSILRGFCYPCFGDFSSISRGFLIHVRAIFHLSYWDFSSMLRGFFNPCYADFSSDPCLDLSSVHNPSGIWSNLENYPLTKISPYPRILALFIHILDVYIIQDFSSRSVHDKSWCVVRLNVIRIWFAVQSPPSFFYTFLECHFFFIFV